MSANATSAIAKASGAWCPPARALQLEKPRRASTSGDGSRDFDERRGTQPTRRQAYRFDTNSTSSRNGPALDSAYAAQVVAQALPSTSAAAVRAAYRSRGAAPALLFDERF